MSNSNPASKLMYTSIPVVAFVLHILNFRIKVSNNELVRKIAILCGSISYSLYITHFPLLLAFSHYINHPAIYAVTSLISVFVVSYLLEKYVQPSAFRILKNKATRRIIRATSEKIRRRRRIYLVKKRRAKEVVHE